MDGCFGHGQALYVAMSTPTLRDESFNYYGGIDNVKDICKRIEQTCRFLKAFDEAWASDSIPNPPKEHVQSRMADIKPSGYEKALSELFELEEAGVTYGSDLLTYIFASRLSISLEKKLREGEGLKEINELWLEFVNYLLLTNVFEPNNTTDKKDFGTGKYQDKQEKIRKELTREIILEILDFIDPVKIIETIIEYGRVVNGQLKPLKKTQLKGIGKELRLADYELNQNKKEDLVEKIKGVSNNYLRNWIVNLDQDHEYWDSLSKIFYVQKTLLFY